MKKAILLLCLTIFSCTTEGVDEESSPSINEFEFSNNNNNNLITSNPGEACGLLSAVVEIQSCGMNKYVYSVYALTIENTRPYVREVDIFVTKNNDLIESVSVTIPKNEYTSNSVPVFSHINSSIGNVTVGISGVTIPGIGVDNSCFLLSTTPEIKNCFQSDNNSGGHGDPCNGGFIETNELGEEINNNDSDGDGICNCYDDDFTDKDNDNDGFGDHCGKMI